MMGFHADTIVMLDKAILAAGVSQRELARRLGISEPRVCQMLSSRSNLTLRTVERILAALPPTTKKDRA